MRWIPFEIDPFAVRNRLRNKMIRPTTIPQTLEGQAAYWKEHYNSSEGAGTVNRFIEEILAISP